MIQTLRKIAEIIEGVARKEDSDLKNISNQGIFYMPELAFVYACGKAIMENREHVFGDLKPEWKRETELGNGGPTDLLFECQDGKCIAIEFKLRDTGEAYVRDIEKLLRLNPSEKYFLVFCALVDVFSSKIQIDERIVKVETYPKARVVSLLNPKPHFVTKQHWYKSDTSCVVGFWGLNMTVE
jgi:hypothetical protein